MSALNTVLRILLGNLAKIIAMLLTNFAQMFYNCCSCCSTTILLITTLQRRSCRNASNPALISATDDTLHSGRLQ